MNTSSRRAVTLVALVVCAVALTHPVWGRAIQPVGTENRIDEPTPFRIKDPVVAMVGDQRPLVAWTNERFGILGRFLDAPTASDFTLVANSDFPSNPGSGNVVTRHDPRLVALSNGDFLLLWTEEHAFLRAAVFSYDLDVQSRDVYARRFDAGGSPVGEAFRINELDGRMQSHARAVVLDGERLAITWEATGTVYARLVDLNGTSGPQIRVNQSQASQTPRPTLARDISGNVLVTWTGRDDHGAGIMARLFDSGLSPLADELVVNSETRLGQSSPSITAGRTGGFLVAWKGRTGFSTETRIFTRLVGSDGVPVGSERQVSGDYGEGDAGATVVTCLDGSYLVLWLNWIPPFATFVGAIELDDSGRPVSQIFTVNSEVPQPQRRLDAGVAADGSILVTWEGFADHSKLGVSVRRLEGPRPLTLRRVLH